MERNEIAAICLSGDLTLDDYVNITKYDISYKKILSSRIPFLRGKKQNKIVSEKEKTEKVLNNNQNFLFYGDKEYPDILKQINDPPLVLFYKGDISILKNDMKIAIVGSRNANDYGLKYTEKFSRQLCDYNFVIVSGMAAGIDGMAHRGALKGNGKTIAVLGSGINVPYPASNRNIYYDICKKGLIVSEYIPDTPPFRYNFPRRNRIVVGLSKGVFITQAALNSGSMISARLASENNRDVFALPGNINSKQSEGTNWLIKNGAKPVTDIQDILEEYDIKYEKRGVKKTIDDSWGIVGLLRETPKTFTELLNEIKISRDELVLELTKLQINGSITEINGKWKTF